MSLDKLADGVPLTDEEIKNLAAWEFTQGSVQASTTLEENLKQAYAAYHNELVSDAGQGSQSRYNIDPVSGETTQIDSSSVQRSSDVSDAIEWIKPQIIRAIVESPEAVRFEPLRPEDEEQANVEADYCYHYFLQKCNGYMAVYSAVVDALITKNCVTATYWQEKATSRVESYEDLTDVGLADLLEPDEKDTEVVIEDIFSREGFVLHPTTGQPIPSSDDPSGAQPLTQTLHDATVRRRQTKGELKVSAIPLDKFRVRKGWDSVQVDDDTPFCGYETTETAAELVAMGYDPAVIDQLPQEGDVPGEVERLREDVERDEVQPVMLARSQRPIRIYRAYMVLDVNGDGYDERIWITLAGTDGDTLLGWDEVSENPFSTGAVIPQAHKFYAVSVFDKLCLIQQQKTDILQKLDENLALVNDPAKSVLENGVNPDDIITKRRPGHNYRVREQGALQEYPTPKITAEAYQMLGYYDKMRMERIGIDPGMQSIAETFPEESMNTAVERLLSAREELVALMVRSLAETWLKDLFLKIRGALIRHQDRTEMTKLRNKWYQINPAEWIERSSTLVRIGLGTGDRFQLRTGAQQILATQQQAKEQGTPVPYSMRYRAVADLVRSWGREPSDYFPAPEDLVNPASMVAQEVAREAQQAEQVQTKAMMQAQAMDPANKIAEATMAVEKIKAQVKQMEAETSKQQGDQQLVAELRQHTDEMQLKFMEQINEMKQHYDDLRFQYDQLAAKTGVEISKTRTMGRQNERSEERREED